MRTSSDPDSAIAPRRAARWRGNQTGFTLLEVVVGLVLAALVLTTVLQAARTGVLASERADRTVALVSVARSVLDRLGADVPLGDGVRSGMLGGVRWRVEPTPLATRPGVATLFSVRIEVADTRGSITLETHRAMRLTSVGGR